MNNFALFSSPSKDCESAQLLNIHEKLAACATHAELRQALFELITSDSSFKKAEFALAILFTFDLSALKMPGYIEEGLEWLYQRLTLPNLQVCAPTCAEAVNAEPEVAE